jgi:choline dehydrogenase-like flavoprotein
VTSAESLERARFDVIIIGSGVSGGRVAMDLTEAGARCLVLEAGDEVKSEQMPLGEAEMISRLYWNGGLELSQKGSIVFTRGRCVGGGSVVNQALIDRMGPDVLARWGRESGVPWMTEAAARAAAPDVAARHVAPLREAALADDYARAEASMSIREISPSRFNGNVSRVSEAFETLGMSWRPLRRAETEACDGQDCIRCLGGCARESKQSSRITTLRRARANGARLLAQCTVSSIATGPRGVEIRAEHAGVARTFGADRVVLAAGAIGSTSLLLRSGFGSALPRLGRGFYCHPQFMTSAVVDDRVDADRGAFQGATAEGPTSGAGPAEPRFKFETNFVPPIVFHTLFARVGSEVHRLDASYPNRVGVEICLRDTEPGRIRVGAGGRVRLHKELGEADREAKRDATEILREVYATLGAREAEFSPRAFSVHPMGGCSLSDTPSRGVVDPEFRVHGQPNVYVADSSLFPSSTGRNPSLTVMAFATRAAGALLTHAGSSGRGVPV